MQAIARDPADPDITIHRESLADTLVWKQEMVKTRRFSHFSLQHATDRCDFYDRLGRGVATPGNTPRASPQPMSPLTFPPVRMQLVKQVPWLVKLPTYCAGFEAHAGCSAAIRSNFYTMTDRVINMAGSDADREHVYMVGSNSSPHAAAVLIADLTKVSEQTQSVFLDFFQRIRSGWPLQASHHRTEMARTFAGCRYARLSQWLLRVRMRSRPEESKDRFEFLLLSLPNALRLKLAQMFVAAAYQEFTIAAGGVEELSDAALDALVYQLAPQLDQLLAIPLANS
jgi:hypothetical protein